MKTPVHTNALIHETSPYLLQHAHNPVNWLPWGDSALKQAQEEDKLILVSIGYAACHWCHVMAHESFEDEEVARVMNQHFVCIKVDREERPDVDHFFMTSVQLTGIQGGWPLNVVAMPDGKPFWGGTYFPKEQWITVLKKLFLLFTTERPKLAQHADNLTRGIQQVSIPVMGEEPESDRVPPLLNAVKNWEANWDMEQGGHRGSPKFPMPVNLSFLLHLQYHHPQSKMSDYLKTTLDKMAMGGIYDQTGGGFARYSVDEIWKVPHFEKMLYDNAQLLGLYSQAFSCFKNPLYKEVVYETVEFMARELTHRTGAFYSSLDADSEGEEGKFYTWEKQELKEILGPEFDLFAAYYNVNKAGLWENDRYILMRTVPDEAFARRHNMTLQSLREQVGRWKALLMEVRKTRVRPSLDDKTVTSWNALMIEGLCQAFKAFGEMRFRDMALANGRFICAHLLAKELPKIKSGQAISPLWEGRLFHTWKENKAAIPGFMEDYAQTISAFIALYEITGDETWTEHAQKMTDYVLEHFYDEKHRLFLFSEKGVSNLPADRFQMEDNVTPSSNSVMGHNLLRLSSLTGNTRLKEIAVTMLQNAFPLFLQHPASYANWGSLALLIHHPFYEVVVTGNAATGSIKQMQSRYRPNVVWAPLTKPGNLALTKERWRRGESTIYVCSDGACRLPVNSVEEAEGIVAAQSSLKQNDDAQTL